MGATKGTFSHGDQISMADVFLAPFLANAIKHDIDVEGLFP
jgi:glutathione S-transferase